MIVIYELSVMQDNKTAFSKAPAHGTELPRDEKICSALLSCDQGATLADWF